MQYTPADVSQLTSLTPALSRLEPASNIFQYGRPKGKITIVSIRIFPPFAYICLHLSYVNLGVRSFKALNVS